MKLIIAGGRDLDVDIDDVLSQISINTNNPDFIYNITEIVSGKAPGIDSCGELFAQQNDILIKEFYPDWEKYGKSAGPIRNRKMAEYADALLLIWDGKSRGSASMKKEMEKLNKPIFEIIV